MHEARVLTVTAQDRRCLSSAPFPGGRTAAGKGEGACPRGIAGGGGARIQTSGPGPLPHCRKFLPRATLRRDSGTQEQAEGAGRDPSGHPTGTSGSLDRGAGRKRRIRDKWFVMTRLRRLREVPGPDPGWRAVSLREHRRGPGLEECHARPCHRRDVLPGVAPGRYQNPAGEGASGGRLRGGRRWAQARQARHQRAGGFATDSRQCWGRGPKLQRPPETGG